MEFVATESALGIMNGVMKAILTGLMLLLTGVAGAAAATSEWAESHGGKLRLIAPGGAPESGVVKAGIEIEMEPGWKTYWRNPGDAGIPPFFDHSASTNIAEIKIDFPAPKRFVDAAGTSIGYKETVILPVTIVPADPDAAILLDLSVEYGLCEEICVPANAKSKLLLTGVASRDQDIAERLAAFAERVPRPAENGFAVNSVARDGGALIVAADLPTPDADHDLLVEGPQEWYLPPPSLESKTDKTATWRISLEWMPKDAKTAGAPLRFTLINGKRAVDQIWRLD